MQLGDIYSEPLLEERCRGPVLKTLVKPMQTATTAERASLWMDIRAVQSWFPRGRMVVGILGSSTFHDPFSPSICRYLGEELWQAGIAILTIQSEGIGEMVTWSYIMRGGSEAKQSAFHLTSDENKRPGDVVEKSSMGWVVAGGATNEENRRLFSMITPVYILIEGGPRSAHMARTAMQQGAIIIPVSRCGGAARGLFGAPIFPKPSGVPLKQWILLRDPWEDVRNTVVCLVRIIQALYNTTTA